MRIFCFLFLFVNTLIAQEISYPQNYFRSPLDIPLYLSGNFGELRSNHFHAGIDIKTQGVEGKKVYAVADGFVSRIKVSPYGYGNALYITHPNGYTSVYGHLKKFGGKIQEYIKRKQYQKKAFSIQLFPTPFEFQVKKGDLVAYSGNTGGSGGPHLHFEIRNTKSEHPINPLFFGFDIQDNLKPDIYNLMVYPLGENSHVNHQSNDKRYKSSGKNGEYRLNDIQTIEAFGEIGLGIHGVDRMNGTGNKYGLHRISLYINDAIYFDQQIDEFAFHEGRYINSHIDYEHYRRYRRRFQKSFVDEGNKLRIYQLLKERGIINIEKDSLYRCEYRLIDFNGNQSSLRFNLKGSELSQPKTAVLKDGNIVKYFKHQERNQYKTDQLLLDIPANTLYKDIYFKYREGPSVLGSITPIHYIHDHFTPLHSYMTVSIKAYNIDQELKSKAVIFSTVDGRSKYAEGGKWNGNTMSVKTRSFGGYGIGIDSVPPKITPINISNGAYMGGKWSISLKVKDQFSGLKNYHGEIDGNWVLFEYDAKRNLMSHYFDEKVPKGEHTLKFTAEDKVGNVSTYQVRFKR